MPNSVYTYILIVLNWNHFEMTLLILRINFYLLGTFFVHILVVFVLFLLSLRFGQISPLAFFSWFTGTSDRNAESCNCIPSNYWPAWVGFETAISWQCSPGTTETQRLNAPKGDNGWSFWSYKSKYLFFLSGLP